MYSKNELNSKARGGSELMAERLLTRLPEELVNEFQFILSRVRDIDESKFRIYWVHDLPWDPETNHLKNQTSIDRFHQIVFCGDWQYNQFQNICKLPWQSNIRVINNGIIPFSPEGKKSNEEIRLIYTSTPQRGLEILLPVFDALSKKYDNIHLDVFSSFKIYGWEERDKSYEPLYDMARNHPKITYHGFQPNEVVREHLEKAHILAYPSIWMECNSLAVIEAMSAGVMCVHPNYGGIVDSTGNLSISYPWLEDKNAHANEFYQVMCYAIENVLNDDLQNYLKFVKIYADQRYNIDGISSRWRGLLGSIVAQNPSKEIPKAPTSYFNYKVG
jgi:glycosyltransferase involved in cell wall biosynthesis